jgi:DNA-binding GntR family transcriptional regulator
VKRSPSAPRLARAIREAILRGVYLAGGSCARRSLRRCSRSAILLREALYTLASEGLVEFVPNRGARVRPISSKEMREMAEVRSALAAQGIRQAWPNMKPATLVKARAIVLRMEKARDPLIRVRLYADFHEAILAPAGRPYLVATIRGIILSGLRYMPAWLEAWAGTGVASPPGFTPVLDALEQGDLAEALLHLQRVWGEQEGMLAGLLGAAGDAGGQRRRGGPRRPAPRRSSAERKSVTASSAAGRMSRRS